MPLSLDQIRELRDKLEPLSYGTGGVQVKFPFKTDEMCLTAFPSTQERLTRMQQLLEPYEKQFINIHLQIEPDRSFCWQFLNRIDFMKFRSALISVLKAEIDALCRREPNEPLYAFVLGISPAHRGLEIFWNTPAAWKQRGSDYAVSGSNASPSTKYNGPDFEGATLSYNDPAWSVISAILEQQENVCSEFGAAGINGGGTARECS